MSWGTISVFSLDADCHVSGVCPLPVVSAAKITFKAGRSLSKLSITATAELAPSKQLVAVTFNLLIWQSSSGTDWESLKLIIEYQSAGGTKPITNMFVVEWSFYCTVSETQQGHIWGEAHCEKKKLAKLFHTEKDARHKDRHIFIAKSFMTFLF